MSKNDVKLTVRIDEKDLPMHPFVQRIIRKTVLAMLSTLKGVKIQDDASVEIRVKEAA